MLEKQLIETWEIHNRINHYLLEEVPPAALGNVSASKGRTVSEQFAHIHNVRLMWLKSAAPELLAGLDKIEQKGVLEKEMLHQSLAASAKAITTLLEKALVPDGKIKGFKPHPVAFVGYLVSHESHHRGQIVVTLKQSGHKLGNSVTFGLWQWGTR